MKNFIKSSSLSVALLFLSGLIFSCESEKTVSENELPSDAQQFVSDYFASASIANVQQERDLGSNEFIVFLQDGTEIKFDEKGVWQEVDGPGTQSIPVDFIPENIQNYISSTYAGAEITAISKDRQGYDVDLSNGMDLKFDTSGNFKKVD